jgi:thiamine-monophosphate kinase
VSETWLAAFCSGLAEDQGEFGITLLGGDTVSMPAAAPVLSVTAFGSVPRDGMKHRFTGRPGDALYVSGTIGDAAVGLALLSDKPGPWRELNEADRFALVTRYRLPRPRTALIPALRLEARAAMDVSDGLVGDCDKLAGSSGCSAVIEAENVPLSPALKEAAQDPALLAMLITGGDDYEILAAVPSEREGSFRMLAGLAGVPVSRIGSLIHGAGPTEVRLNGRAMDLTHRSYVHGSHFG